MFGDTGVGVDGMGRFESEGMVLMVMVMSSLVLVRLALLDCLLDLDIVI